MPFFRTVDMIGKVSASYFIRLRMLGMDPGLRRDDGG